MVLLCGLFLQQTVLGKTVVDMDSIEDEEIIEPSEKTIIPPNADYIPVLMYHHFAIRDMGETAL